MDIAKSKASSELPAPEIAFVRENYAQGIKLPWQIKMALKIILAKLPFSYTLWSALGVFRHGDTASDLHALHNSFERYFDAYTQRYGRSPKSVLELGPGDSIGHALSGKSKGVEQSWLVDVGDFATYDPAHYSAYCGFLGESLADKPTSFSRENILKFCNAAYFTQGLKDLRTLASSSVDLSFSTAVLEHIRRAEFESHMKELFRLHKPGGLSCHWVDLHDHLGGALNSLMFSERFWESPHVQNAGFYTNRLTMAEILELAQAAGFKTEIVKVIQWKDLPTAQKLMAKSFQEKSKAELNVCTFLVYFEKPL